MSIQYSIPNASGDFDISLSEQAGLALLGGDITNTIQNTVDAIIDIEGFEKYGPAPGTFFNLYGNFLVPANSLTPLSSQSFFQEWASISWGGNSPQMGLIAGIANNGGTALALFPAFGNPLFIRRNMPTNYTRIIMGFAMMTGYGSTVGAYLCDNGNGQCFLGVDNGGRVIFTGSATLYTSPVKVQPFVRHYFEMDVFFHNTLGTWQIWMDGVSLASGTGANTRGGTANNYANSIVLTQGAGGLVAFDDMYWRDNSAGTATPFGDCSVKALPVSGDSSVAFTPTALLGPWHAQGTNTTNNAGANLLLLLPVTPAVNMTVNSIGMLPRTTSATAKFKGVIYSDSAGNPGSLLSSGTEVTGCTSGKNLSMPLVTPQALTGGTQYWIGVINDTAISFQAYDTLTGAGQSKANTYSSGAPAGPLSGMSIGGGVTCMWGVCTSVAANYAGVNKVTPPPISAGVMLTYNQSSTVLNEDLFDTQDLTTTPTSIYTVKVSVMAQKPATGVRSMDIRLKTGSVTSSGTNTAQVPVPTPYWYSSRFDTDPTTGSAWDVGGGEQWSSTFASSKFTVTNNGLTANATDLNHTDTIISISSHTTGQYYFEMTVLRPTSDDLAWGLAPSTASNGSIIGNSGQGISLRNTRNWRLAGGETASGMSVGPTTNDILGFAVDLTNSKIWVRNVTVSSGTWYGNNGTGDPATGTNGFSISSLAGIALFLAFSSNQNGIVESVILNSGGSAFVAAAPAGYSAWNSHPQTGINSAKIGYKTAT